MSLKKELEVYASILMAASDHVNKQGLLALEDLISTIKTKIKVPNNDYQRHPLFFGLVAITNALNEEIIKRYFDNRIANCLSREQVLPLKLLKEGLLDIQAGVRSRNLAFMLDSIIPDDCHSEGFVEYLTAISSIDVFEDEILFNDNEIDWT
jgi:hypothetical protein